MVILHFLNKRDYYTYELNKAISEYVQINESTAYAIFKKLINNGLCDYYIIESEYGPARKYYQITTLGKKELARMISIWEKFSSAIENLLRRTE